MEIKIYTDGSSLGNPGPGGFCALIKGCGESLIVKGGEDHTTNNRMEMSAMIAGLYTVYRTCPDEKKCQVYSDSELLIKTLNLGWKRKKNLDLWKKLDAIIAKFEKIEWQWIKGHAGHKENTIVDKIAVAQAKKFKIKKSKIKITI